MVTLLRWALAIGFVVVGIDKLRSESIWPAFFADLPGGDLLRYLTAMIQIAGGLLMMRATTLTAGLGLIALTMAGAIATWFVVLGDPSGARTSAVLLAALVIVAIRTRPATCTR